jgi:hypothetical protein
MMRTFTFILLWAFSVALRADVSFPLRSNDVVAFVGGADVSSAQQGGQLESLLACAWPTARFRNFGWEGDTVYAQPRDFNFPPLTEHLRKAGATVIVLQFGRTEALAKDAPDFRAAYEALITKFQSITPRLVLVAPPPFENAGGLLPNLAEKNGRLGEYARVIRELAQAHQFAFVDLFSTGPRNLRLTDDGLQLTPKGQAICAITFATQIGLNSCARHAGEPKLDGSWPNDQFEKLREAIVIKNRFWFNYWRPQNWAFLGGDRTEQPSSRDYRDLKIRWFPKEIEEFRTLIANQETEVTRLAVSVGGKEQ